MWEGVGGGTRGAVVWLRPCCRRSCCRCSAWRCLRSQPRACSRPALARWRGLAWWSCRTAPWRRPTSLKATGGALLLPAAAWCAGAHATRSCCCSCVPCTAAMLRPQARAAPAPPPSMHPPACLPPVHPPAWQHAVRDGDARRDGGAHGARAHRRRAAPAQLHLFQRGGSLHCQVDPVRAGGPGVCRHQLRALEKGAPGCCRPGCACLLGVRLPALCSPSPAACPPRAVKLQRAPASMPEAPCIPAVPTSAPRAMRRTESSCSARRRRM